MSADFFHGVFTMVNAGCRIFTSVTIPLHMLVLVVLARNFASGGELDTVYYKFVFSVELVDTLNAVANLANHIVRETSLYERLPWWMSLNMSIVEAGFSINLITLLAIAVQRTITVMLPVSGQSIAKSDLLKWTVLVLSYGIGAPIASIYVVMPEYGGYYANVNGTRVSFLNSPTNRAWMRTTMSMYRLTFGTACIVLYAGSIAALLLRKQQTSYKMEKRFVLISVLLSMPTIMYSLIVLYANSVAIADSGVLPNMTQMWIIFSFLSFFGYSMTFLDPFVIIGLSTGVQKEIRRLFRISPNLVKPINNIPA